MEEVEESTRRYSLGRKRRTGRTDRPRVQAARQTLFMRGASLSLKRMKLTVNLTLFVVYYYCFFSGASFTSFEPSLIYSHLLFLSSSLSLLFPLPLLRFGNRLTDMKLFYIGVRTGQVYKGDKEANYSPRCCEMTASRHWNSAESETSARSRGSHATTTTNS